MKTSMKTLQIEIPDGKRAEVINGVLTFVDNPPQVKFKYNIGDKVLCATRPLYCYGVLEIIQQINRKGVPWYRLKHVGLLREDELELCVDPENIAEPKDITEQIKTFEDAYLWCTENGHFDLLRAYDYIVTDTLLFAKLSKDLVAYLKLRIITLALNEGWEPIFDENEDRWKLYLSTFEDTVALQHVIFRLNPDIMWQLDFKSESIAKYAASQFKELYMDFFKGDNKLHDMRKAILKKMQDI